MQSKINTGIIVEWITLIDPKMVQGPSFEKKIDRMIKSQAALLLGSEMREVRSAHWILTKVITKEGVSVEFSLVAYSGEVILPRINEKENFRFQLNLFEKKIRRALAQENYEEAARLRDKILYVKNKIALN
jgi:excinuclease UvrABC helicase subunit UvrB